MSRLWSNVSFGQKRPKLSAGRRFCAHRTFDQRRDIIHNSQAKDRYLVFGTFIEVMYPTFGAAKGLGHFAENQKLHIIHTLKTNLWFLAAGRRSLFYARTNTTLWSISNFFFAEAILILLDISLF